MIRLAIVSPCFNEEAILETSAQRLNRLLKELKSFGKISDDSFILFVNDGSTDRTWEIIQNLHRCYQDVYGLSLASNVGHQIALLAGMNKVMALCDAAITIDADLQDDLTAVTRMIEKHEEGYDVVYGVKTSRKADSFLKRESARLFYGLQRRMGVRAINNHADFRLMSAKALKILAQYPERNIYLRGIIPSMGLKSALVEDPISPRQAGQSKYTIRKMVSLALDGITSFSIKPIHLIISLGIFSLLLSFAMVIHVFIAWYKGQVVSGWTELMVSLWFLGSVILLSIGIIGLYVGKIYTETKRRPLYIEDEVVGLE